MTSPEITANPSRIVSPRQTRSFMRVALLTVAICAAAYLAFIYQRDRLQFPATVAKTVVASSRIDAIDWFDGERFVLTCNAIHWPDSERRVIQQVAPGRATFAATPALDGFLLADFFGNASFVASGKSTRLLLHSDDSDSNISQTPGRMVISLQDAVVVKQKAAAATGPQQDGLNSAPADVLITIHEVQRIDPQRASESTLQVCRYDLTPLTSPRNTSPGAASSIVSLRATERETLPAADYIQAQLLSDGVTVIATRRRPPAEGSAIELSFVPEKRLEANVEGSILEIWSISQNRILALERPVALSKRWKLRLLEHHQDRVTDSKPPLTIPGTLRGQRLWSVGEHYLLLESSDSSVHRFFNWPISRFDSEFRLIDFETWSTVAVHQHTTRDYHLGQTIPTWTRAAFDPDNEHLHIGTSDGRVLKINIRQWIAASEGDLE